jgi:cysteine desulfurase
VTPKRPIYLDYHATTPVDPRVFEAMRPYFMEHFGNAASTSHVFGWRAEAAVTGAREAIARLVSANPREIVFTSGATESNNLAILGAARARHAPHAHVVTSAIEHRAVLDPCRRLESEGFAVTYLMPDAHGVTSAAAVADALTERTVLVSVMAANNEIGTLNPVGEIARVCKGSSFTRTPFRRSGRSRSTSTRSASILCRSRRTRCAGRKAWARSSCARLTHA